MTAALSFIWPIQKVSEMRLKAIADEFRLLGGSCRDTYRLAGQLFAEAAKLGAFSDADDAILRVTLRSVQEQNPMTWPELFIEMLILAVSKPHGLSTEEAWRAVRERLAAIIERHAAVSACAPANEDIESIKQAYAAAMDDNGTRIVAIASDTSKSSDQRMREIAAIDYRALAWNSRRWEELLHVSSAAVRQTDFWKIDRNRALRRDD